MERCKLWLPWHGNVFFSRRRRVGISSPRLFFDAPSVRDLEPAVFCQFLHGAVIDHVLGFKAVNLSDRGRG